MPNGIAYLALLLWPLVCLALFRRTSVERAIIWSLLGGYLLLPPIANFNLPLVPPLDKTSIPSLSAFLICVVVLGRKLTIWPTSRIARLLLTGFVLGAIPTVLSNSDPIVFEVLPNSYPIVYRAWELPGLGLRDVFSALVSQVIVLFPFVLARQFLASELGMREMLTALVIAGLFYSIPALIEIRFSPQMNTWIYGFFQHDFVQTMRSGGFRPLVFLPHPLWFAFFVVSTLLASATLAKVSDEAVRGRFILVMFYFAGLLFLCKSLASFAYGLCLLPLVFFTSPRVQIQIAFAFAIVACSYPLLRGAGLVPVDAILAWAESINPERAASLAYRIGNENVLLDRAAEKPWLGWGGWGRNLVHDTESGEIITIPDGRWIIVFGTYGWLGYIWEFGLLSMPLLMLSRAALVSTGNRVSPFAACFALILGINLVDMLLNAALTPITWVLAGSIMGYAERLKLQEKAEAQSQEFRLQPVIGRPSSEAGPRTYI